MVETEISSVLNDLLETAKDGAEGFRRAAEEASDPSLKQLFTKYASQREGYALELQELMQENGSKPRESGHISATLHRGWLTVRERITEPDDKTLIDACESGEDIAMKKYGEAVKKALPRDIESLVQRQYLGVKEAHAVMRNLKQFGRPALAAV